MQDIVHIEPSTFTECDWQTYAGAEKFPNGDQPFTALVYFNDSEALLVVDAKGAEIYDSENIFHLTAFDSTSALHAASTVSAMLQLGCHEGSIHSRRLTARGLGSYHVF